MSNYYQKIERMERALENYIEEVKSIVASYVYSEGEGDILKNTKYSENLISILDSYLISEEEKTQRENEKEIDTNSVEDSIFIVSEIQKMGLKFWDGFRLYIDKNKPDGFDWSAAFDLVSRLSKSKNLTTREITFGKKALDYIQITPRLIDEVKALSKLEETEIVEVKFIYDKLLLISKDDWKRIIDLANQTNIFSNLELSNVKSVQISLAKKEKVKEQALLRAYESIKKLKRFGIKV